MTLSAHHVWGNTLFRAFISHSSKQKKLATDLKSELSKYAISAFVTSDNIPPGTAWQPWIEHALISTNYVVALVTDDFNNSAWANQEVGFARARQIPTLCIMYGADPKGFINAYQAIDCKNENAAHIASIIHNALFNSHIFFETTWNILTSEYAYYPNEEKSRQILNALSSDKLFPLTQEHKRMLLAAVNSGQNPYQPQDFLPELANRLEQLTGEPYKIHEISPKYQQIILNDPNHPVRAYSGQFCTTPGVYWTQCRPDTFFTLNMNDIFPLCGDSNLHRPHAACWFLRR